MAIVLSLLTAVIYGAADFAGGLSAKRATLLQVIAGSHLVGGIGVLLVSLLVAERFTWTDLGLGAIGGVFGVGGVALLYRRLAVGPMNIVAPLTGITAAVVPMVRGLADGDRLSSLAWAGVALGLLAVGLVSMSSDDARADEADDPILRVVGESLLAGVGFGTIFIMLDATDASTSPWPVFGARLLTSTVLVSTAFAVRHRTGRALLPADIATMALIALVGLLDTGANVAFLYAANAGRLAVVSVLSSLYPISTVLLARLLLSEPMNRLQGAGFVTAIVATELLVLS